MPVCPGVSVEVFLKDQVGVGRRLNFEQFQAAFVLFLA
mgnify:CR=1 FL=1